MFIRPNEFEAQLAAAKAIEPTYGKSDRAAGTIFMLIFAPIMLGWLTFLACWILAMALVRTSAGTARLLGNAADFSGWLVLR
jgi:hypothetical protein